MKIKSFNLIPVRTAITENKSINQSIDAGRGVKEKGILIHCWTQTKTTIDWQFLRELKIDLPHDLATPLLEIHPNKMKSAHQRDIYMKIYIAIQFKIIKTINN